MLSYVFASRLKTHIGVIFISSICLKYFLLNRSDIVRISNAAILFSLCFYLSGLKYYNRDCVICNDVRGLNLGIYRVILLSSTVLINNTTLICLKVTIYCIYWSPLWYTNRVLVNLLVVFQLFPVVRTVLKLHYQWLIW